MCLRIRHESRRYVVCSSDQMQNKGESNTGDFQTDFPHSQHVAGTNRDDASLAARAHGRVSIKRGVGISWKGKANAGIGAEALLSRRRRAGHCGRRVQ